jgi:hypothetical protein
MQPKQESSRLPSQEIFQGYTLHQENKLQAGVFEQGDIFYPDGSICHYTAEISAHPFDHEQFLIQESVCYSDSHKTEANNRHIIFLVDVSGSMADGQRIESVRKLLMNIVKLRPSQDTITLVSFNQNFSIILDNILCSDVVPIIDNVVQRLRPGGTTRIDLPLLAIGSSIKVPNPDNAMIVLMTDGNNDREYPFALENFTGEGLRQTQANITTIKHDDVINTITRQCKTKNKIPIIPIGFGNDYSQASMHYFGTSTTGCNTLIHIDRVDELKIKLAQNQLTAILNGSMVHKAFYMRLDFNSPELQQQPLSQEQIRMNRNIIFENGERKNILSYKFKNKQEIFKLQSVLKKDTAYSSVYGESTEPFILGERIFSIKELTVCRNIVVKFAALELEKLEERIRYLNTKSKAVHMPNAEVKQLLENILALFHPFEETKQNPLARQLIFRIQNRLDAMDAPSKAVNFPSNSHSKNKHSYSSAGTSKPVTVKNIVYTMVARQTDLTASTSQYFYFNSLSCVLLVERNSAALQAQIALIKKRCTHPDLRQNLTELIQYYQEYFNHKMDKNEFLKSHQNPDRNNTVFLDAFINIKARFEKDDLSFYLTPLIAESLVGLMQANLLEKGALFHYSGTYQAQDQGKNIHHFLMYKTQNNLFIIDPNLPSYIYDVSNLDTLKWVLDKYKDMQMPDLINLALYDFKLLEQALGKNIEVAIPGCFLDVLEQEENDTVDTFRCLITEEVMRHPVVIYEGKKSYYFDKSSLMEHFSRGRKFNPMTNSPCSTDLITAFELAKKIVQYIDSKNMQVPEKKDQIIIIEKLVVDESYDNCRRLSETRDKITNGLDFLEKFSQHDLAYKIETSYENALNPNKPIIPQIEQSEKNPVNIIPQMPDKKTAELKVEETAIINTMKKLWSEYHDAQDRELFYGNEVQKDGMPFQVTSPHFLHTELIENMFYQFYNDDNAPEEYYGKHPGEKMLGLKKQLLRIWEQQGVLNPLEKMQDLETELEAKLVPALIKEPKTTEEQWKAIKQMNEQQENQLDIMNQLKKMGQEIFASKSPTFFPADPRYFLIREIEEYCKNNPHIKKNSFMDDLKNEKYALTLRKFCASGDFGLIKILLKYSDKLTIDFHETTSSQKGSKTPLMLLEESKMKPEDKDIIRNLLLEKMGSKSDLGINK